jgi:hypothetical protein
MTTTAPAPTKTFYPIAIALVAVAIATMAVVAVYLGQHTPTPAAPASSTAGLRTCDSSVAVAYPALDGGVQVHVLAPGPDVVRVGIIAGPMAYERVLQQQVTKNGAGADFSWVHAHGVSAITVSTKKLGICAIPAPATR